jgi:hypothetical protein
MNQKNQSKVPPYQNVATRTFVDVQCVGIVAHRWNLNLEYPTDVTMSHVSDNGSVEGYAIFRDKYLVKCPYCEACCVILPGRATVEVKKVK